jgi:hypothetical protein
MDAAAAVAIGLSAPSLAQSKMDAGSGPTKGAVSTNDAGSGPTAGATPKMGSTAAGNSNAATSERRKQRGRHPGPEVDRRLAASHADNERSSELRFQKTTTPGTILRRSHSFVWRAFSCPPAQARLFAPLEAAPHRTLRAGLLFAVSFSLRNNRS